MLPGSHQNMMQWHCIHDYWLVTHKFPTKNIKARCYTYPTHPENRTQDSHTQTLMPSLSTKVAANLHRESMRKGVLGELGVGTPNVLTACRFQFKLPTSKAHRAVSSHALFLSCTWRLKFKDSLNFCLGGLFKSNSNK